MYLLKLLTARKNILLAALLLTVLSCQRYYMPVKTKTDNTGDFISSNNSQKYFILRQGGNSYALKNIGVDKTSMTLSGTLSTVDLSHRLYINAVGDKYKYSEKKIGDNGLTEAAVLNEVHLYVKNTMAIDIAKPFVMPLDQIEKIEVIQHDRKRTNTSYVLGGIGIGVGVMVITGVIIALTKSSCPFVSVYDGNQYQVQGELFGGAVNRQLERPDYVPLKIEPAGGAFQIRISNELKERQYTNFADLLVIEHSNDVQAFIDTDGKVYQVSHPAAPDAALLNNRPDVLNTLRTKDDLYCSFNDTSISSGINEITVSFNRQGTGKQAKLLLHLKNSYWFDYLYGEFTRNFGSKYEKWQQKQQHKPAEQMIRWTEDQHIPLSVSIQTATGWKEIRKIKTIGPLANRSIVIPVDLETVSGLPVKLKLSTGFMFWEIDYAAMDFSSDQPVNITRLSPSVAVDEKDNSVLRELAADDDQYLSQPEVGSYATLTYPFKRQAQPGHTYSVVLYTGGYYEPIREYSGKPNTAMLKKFREPGELSRFSLTRYQMIPKEQTIIALNTD